MKILLHVALGTYITGDPDAFKIGNHRRQNRRISLNQPVLVAPLSLGVFSPLINNTGSFEACSLYLYLAFPLKGQPSVCYFVSFENADIRTNKKKKEKEMRRYDEALLCLCVYLCLSRDGNFRK